MASWDCSGSQDTTSGTASTTGNSRRFRLVRVKEWSEIALVVRELLQGQPKPGATLGIFSGACQGGFQGLQRQSGYHFRDNPIHWKLSAFSFGAFHGVVRDCHGCQGTVSRTTPTTGNSRHFSLAWVRGFSETAVAVKRPPLGQPQPLETLGISSGLFQGLKRCTCRLRSSESPEFQCFRLHLCLLHGLEALLHFTLAWQWSRQHVLVSRRRCYQRRCQS